MNIDPDDAEDHAEQERLLAEMQYEERAPYIADVFLVVAYDKQVEIRR